MVLILLIKINIALQYIDTHEGVLVEYQCELEIWVENSGLNGLHNSGF